MKNEDSKIQVIGVKELMEILHVGKDRAYALMRSKSFPSMQIGKTYCITRNNLEAWLDQNAGRTIII